MHTQVTLVNGPACIRTSAYATYLKTQAGLWVLYLPAEEAHEACGKVCGGSQPGNERADWMTFGSLGR